MGGNLDQGLVRRFLEELGRRISHPDSLILLGGGALQLLGSSRPTLDLDYVGDDLHKNDLQQTIDALAEEMQVTVEAVPFGDFVPVPADAQARHHFVGRFGALDVYVFDLYSIAVSKIDRGFDTDIADVAFLVQSNLIDIVSLEQALATALVQAREFDLNPVTAQEHFAELRRVLGEDRDNTQS